MKSIVVSCLFLLFLSGCSQHNENISMQDKKIYEFSWCSYKDGFKAQDLNELISYLGFLKNSGINMDFTKKLNTWIHLLSKKNMIFLG